MQTKLVILFITLIASISYKWLEVSHSRPNYLYQGSTDLSYHQISSVASVDKKGIVVLGNSPVAGNNIPAHTTTSDYLSQLVNEPVFNLGRMEQNLVESLVYLNQALASNLRLVLIGLNPRSFPASVQESSLLAKGRNVLKKYQSESTVKQLQSSSHLKLNFLSQFFDAGEGIPPSRFQIAFRTLAYKLKEKIFGPLYSKQIKGSIPDNIDYLMDGRIINNYLNAIIQFCNDKKLQVAFYQVPIHKRDDIYPPEKYLQFKNLVQQKIESHGLLFFDASLALPSNNKYFIDFIHRTPLGNKDLADIIHNRLAGHDLL